MEGRPHTRARCPIEQIENMKKKDRSRERQLRGPGQRIPTPRRDPSPTSSRALRAEAENSRPAVIQAYEMIHAKRDLGRGTVYLYSEPCAVTLIPDQQPTLQANLADIKEVVLYGAGDRLLLALKQRSTTLVPSDFSTVCVLNQKGMAGEDILKWERSASKQGIYISRTRGKAFRQLREITDSEIRNLLQLDPSLPSSYDSRPGLGSVQPANTSTRTDMDVDARLRTGADPCPKHTTVQQGFPNGLYDAEDEIFRDFGGKFGPSKARRARDVKSAPRGVQRPSEAKRLLQKHTSSSGRQMTRVPGIPDVHNTEGPRSPFPSGGQSPSHPGLVGNFNSRHISKISKIPSSSARAKDQASIEQLRQSLESIRKTGVRNGRASAQGAGVRTLGAAFGHEPSTSRAHLEEFKPGSGPYLKSTEAEPPQSTNFDRVIAQYSPRDGSSLSITQGDLCRLTEHEYLNDTLVEFYCRYTMERMRLEKPEVADSVHIFSPFFYEKINVLDGDKLPEVAYSRVKRWTNRVDCFKKKWIMVPINEHNHWYLGLISNPGKLLEEHPLGVRGSLDDSASEEYNTKTLDPSVVDLTAFTNSGPSHAHEIEALRQSQTDSHQTSRGTARDESRLETPSPSANQRSPSIPSSLKKPRRRSPSPETPPMRFNIHKEGEEVAKHASERHISRFDPSTISTVRTCLFGPTPLPTEPQDLDSACYQREEDHRPLVLAQVQVKPECPVPQPILSETTSVSRSPSFGSDSDLSQIPSGSSSDECRSICQPVDPLAMLSKCQGSVESPQRRRPPSAHVDSSRSQSCLNGRRTRNREYAAQENLQIALEESKHPTAAEQDGSQGSNGKRDKDPHHGTYSRLKRQRGPNEDDLKESYCFVLDSLGAASCKRHVRQVLTRWAEHEAKHKRQQTVRESGLIWLVPRAPLQQNFVDCGVYVLHYMERFLSDPDKFFLLLLNPAATRKELGAWGTNAEIESKRQQLAELILRMAEEQKLERQEPQMQWADTSDDVIEVVETC